VKGDKKLPFPSSLGGAAGGPGTRYPRRPPLGLGAPAAPAAGLQSTHSTQGTSLQPGGRRVGGSRWRGGVRSVLCLGAHARMRGVLQGRYSRTSRDPLAMLSFVFDSPCHVESGGVTATWQGPGVKRLQPGLTWYGRRYCRRRGRRLRTSRTPNEPSHTEGPTKPCRAPIPCLELELRALACGATLWPPPGSTVLHSKRYHGTTRPPPSLPRGSLGPPEGGLQACKI